MMMFGRFSISCRLLSECFALTVLLAEHRGTWNLRNNHLQFPDVVVFPETAQQVQWIVGCSKRTGYRICGRNGRHSYDGTTCTHSIVVDVSRLDSVFIVNIDDGIVRLGAGLTLGRVAVELERYGMALPMGTCSSVGLTGLTLNGGQGPLSRMYGLTSDHLESIQLVDSNGKVINATMENNYSDYLWLARGGGSVGHHYPGIITNLQFRGLPKIPRNSTIWTRVKLTYRPTVNNAVKLLRAWQDFFAGPQLHDPLFKRITAEPWLFMRFRRRRNIHEPALYLVVYFFGNEDLHQVFIERYLPKFEGMGGRAKSRSVERLDELAFHRLVGGVKTNEELVNCSAGYDLKTLWQGFSAVALDKVSEKAFQRVAESIFLHQPVYRRYAEFKPLGAAVHDLEKNDTAFWHRDAIWWVLVNHFYEPKDFVLNHSMSQSSQGHSEFVEAMGASFDGEYAGYVQHSNSTSRDLRRYYGNNSRRIQLIKRVRDPHNLFRHYLPYMPRKLPFKVD
jgi:FAD/FMN-containing dehydrogenase